MTYNNLPAFDASSLGNRIVRAFGIGHFDEAVCRRSLLQLLRPAPICPCCKRSLSRSEIEKMLDDKDIRCECGRKSSPRSGTALEGVHAEYRTILLIACMSFWGVNIKETASRTGVSVDTVRRVTLRLKVPHY